MSTVKISQLPLISQINANTANTLFAGVDIPTGATGKMTAKTLAQGLFSNEKLNVGGNPVVLDNTVAQFASSDPSFLQVNLENFNSNASGDYVVTADIGTNTTYYIDMGFAGSNYNYAGYTVYNPLDGYLLVQGNTSPGSPGGNLVIGTVTTGKTTDFFNGGSLKQNIVASVTANGFLLKSNSNITFTDGSVQSVAASPASYSQAAFALANSVSASVTYQSGVDTTQNTAISNVTANTIYLQGVTNSINVAAAISANTAQAAFNKANNALENTTGTFAGDLTIAGNTFAQAVNTANLVVVGTGYVSGTLNVNGTLTGNAKVVLANTTFLPTEAALTISASPTVVTPANDGYMIHISGKNGVPSRIVTDSYGTGAYALYAGRAARGTVDSPTALQAGDVIARYSSSGYGTTKYQTLGSGRIDFLAAENYTDANTGSQIQFWNCPIGSNTLTNIATFNGSDVVFAGEVNPQKGFVYTPNVLSGITTTLSIDISNNSLYSFKTNATTTISLNNFKAGKIVEVWITNTDSGAGSNHTITHGCLANNSTIGAASFTLSGLHSAYIKYFSIGGDLSNTFCQVTYS